MPKVETCGNCGQLMTLADDMAGKVVRCPHCKANFIAGKQRERPPVSTPGPARAEADLALPPLCVREITVRDDEVIDSRSRRHGDWKSVSSGINVMYVSLFIFLIAIVVLTAVVTCAGSDRFVGGRQVDALMPLVMLTSCLTPLALVGCGITLLVGLLTCLATPQDSGARGLLIGTLLTLGGYGALLVLLALGGTVGPGAMGRPDILLSILELMGSVVPFVSSVLFVLYLRKLAVYFGDGGLVRNCQLYLTFTVASFAGMMGLGIALNDLAFAEGRRRPLLFLLADVEEWSGLSLLAIFVVVIAAVVWLLYLLRRTRDLIDTAALTARRSRRQFWES